MKLSIVAMVWEDATMYGSWESGEDVLAQGMETTPVCSVGMLAHEDDRTITLVTSVSEAMFGGGLVVPKTWVTRVQKIGEVEDGEDWNVRVGGQLEWKLDG